MTKKPSKNKQSKSPNPYLKYSGMAFQMLIIILLGVGLGMFLDEKFGTGQVFTTICSLFFICASIYISLKDFLKP